MFLHDPHHGFIGLLARPIPLPFEQHLLPGNRYDTGLNHAVHGVVVRVDRGASRGVGNHIDFIVCIAQAGQCEGRVADLGPQAGYDDLLTAGNGGLCQGITNVLVIPGVH